MRIPRRGEPFLQHYDRLKEHGKHLGLAHSGRIDIGYVEAAIHSRLLPDTLAALDLSPDIDIRLHAMRSKQQLEQLQDRVIDIAFLHAARRRRAVLSEKIFSEPVMLAMPKAKALRDPTPAGLHNHPWIAEQESLNPAARRRLLEACQKRGFTPRISPRRYVGHWPRCHASKRVWALPSFNKARRPLPRIT